MRIEAEVFGVEQAVDFSTMKAECFVVLGVFGTSVRVQVSEETMEAIVAGAARYKTAHPEVWVEKEALAETAFEETREQLEGEPSEGAPRNQEPERQFSVMAGLSESVPSEQVDQEEVDPGLGGFFDTEESIAEQKLRDKNKTLMQRRTVPRDEVGNPVVPESPAAALPQRRGGLPTIPMSDDDFPQG